MGDITERLERFAAHANPPLVADERELLREAATLITSLREALEEAKALNNKYALWAYGLAAGLTAILAVMASVAAALVMPSLWPMAAMSGGASIFMLFATWRIWHGIKTENVFEP
jgi:hypothetical protein